MIYIVNNIDPKNEMNIMIKDIIKNQIRKTGMVRALELENEKLEIQIKNSQNELKNLINQINHSQQTLMKLKNQINQSQNATMKLKNQINQSQNATMKLKNQINQLEKEKLKLTESIHQIEERENLSTVPNFAGLKKSLKGKDGYLFLVNDNNYEIKQHYDQSYVNNFNSSLFIENLKYKEEYCKNNNIKYFFFMVPDKSYVCRDLLPFEIKIIKRNYDLIKHLVPDFSEKLDHKCYWKTDTHINFLGGKELSYYMLNYIDKNLKRSHYNKLINEQTIINDINFSGLDLTFADNWSYSDEEKMEYFNEKTLHLRCENLKDLKDSLPEKFKSSSNRETSYYLNENAFTNLRVLILGDSSTNLIINALSIYFKEMILYWDHWIFNKEIIEYCCGWRWSNRSRSLWHVG